MTKKDVLELKRRMTKKGCTFTRMCGCYVNSQKNIILKMEETFLNLDEDDFFKYLEIAKKALSGTLGNNLLELSFLKEENGTEAQNFLLALRDSGLKNENLLEHIYERIIDTYEHDGNYLILLFHDAYDVIKKTSDHNKLDESEEVYTYILCAICPVDLTKAGLGYQEEENRITSRIRDWVVSAPDTGFLFPVFSDRSSDVNAVGYYVRDAKQSQPDFMQEVLGCQPQRTMTEQKKVFQTILKDTISIEAEDPDALVLDIQEDLRDLVDEHKNIYEEENPVLLTAATIRETLEEKGLSETVIEAVEEICEKEFGECPPLAEHLIDTKALEAHTHKKKTAAMQLELDALKQQLADRADIPKEVTEKKIHLQVSEEKLSAVQTEIINGKRCIVIPLEEEEQAILNGSALELPSV